MSSAGLPAALAGPGATAGDETATLPAGTPLEGARPGEEAAVAGAFAVEFAVAAPGADALTEPAVPGRVEVTGAGTGAAESGDATNWPGAGAGAVVGLPAGAGTGALTAGAGAGTPEQTDTAIQETPLTHQVCM